LSKQEKACFRLGMALLADACMIPAKLWVLGLAPRVDLNALMCCAKSSLLFSSSTKPRLSASIILAGASSGHGLASHCWSTFPTHHHHHQLLLPTRPLSHAAPGLHSHNQKESRSISSRGSVLVSPRPDTLNGCRAGHLHARQAWYSFGRGRKVN
jgi:hypothetical protein